jgi:hypothetical protein
MSPLIIIPSAVYSSAPFTAIGDAAIRIDRVVWGVTRLLEAYPEYEIVICDGSGFDFSRILLENQSDRMEILFFNNSRDKVKIYGKGYGEGEILEYVLNNSKKALHHSCYIKLTGGLFVSNFRNILKDCSEFQFNPKIEIRKVPPRIRITSVDTRVVLFNRLGYDKFLRGVHLGVRDFEGFFLEHAVFKSLLQSGNLRSSMIFGTPPKIEGKSGSTGNNYSSFRFTELLWHLMRTVKLIVIRYSLK